jgi:RHS repeat-associated protein
LGNLTYAYDAAGRAIDKGGSLAATGIPAAVSSNTFNADNELTAFNDTTLAYDANGNLLSDGTNHLHLGCAQPLGCDQRGANASFAYDALGRRANKTVNGVITQFVYDGDNSVQELDGSSPPNPTANLLTALGIDEYYARTDSSGAMSFLSDALGSSIALTDSSGGINTGYTYGPFGNVAITGSNSNPYQFAGRENDGTGLYFNRARFYSSTYQRFIAQNLLDFNSGGYNLYRYVLDDPINHRDLSGKGPVDCLKMFIYFRKYKQALEQCQQEDDKCDQSYLWGVMLLTVNRNSVCSMVLRQIYLQRSTDVHARKWERLFASTWWIWSKVRPLIL